MFVICYKEELAHHLTQQALRLLSTPDTKPFIFALTPDFDLKELEAFKGEYYLTSQLFV